MARPAVIRSALVLALPPAIALFPIPAGIAYGLLALSRRARRELPGRSAALALACTFVLSAVLSGRGLGVIALASLAVVVACLLWLLVTRLERDDIVPLLFGMLLLLMLNLVVGMFDVHVRGLERAVGVMLHPNVLGAVVAPTSLIFLPGSAGLGATRWRFLGVTVALIVLAYCASRGAVLAVAVGFMIAATVYLLTPSTGLGRSRPARRVVLAATVTLLGSLVVLSSLPQSPLAARLVALESVADPLSRPFLWSVALDLVAHRPFLGYGPMAWSEYAPVVEPMIRPEITPHSHNQYLEVALWAGILGLGSLVWLGCNVGLRLWNGRHGAPGWSAAGIGALAAIATCSVFDATGSYLQVLVLWVLVVGAALVMTEPHRE